VYIRRTRKKYKAQKLFQLRPGRVSGHPSKGPRQKTICSLGSLEPAPPQQWLALAQRIETALSGQLALTGEVDASAIAERARAACTGAPPRSPPPDGQQLVAIDPARVAVQEGREAGPVHVGHQMWRALELGQILARAGLPERAWVLTEAMVLNRLIAPRSEHAMPDWMRRRSCRATSVG
jgi:hypothetical protein